MTDLDRIKAAFSDLKKKGYLARTSVPGCAGMGCCPQFGPGYKGPRQEKWDKAEKFVYNTTQRVPYSRSYAYSDHVLRERGRYVGNWEKGDKNLPLLAFNNSPYVLYFPWGGNADEIIAAFEAHELPVEWDGKQSTSIGIKSHAHWEQHALYGKSVEVLPDQQAALAS